MQHYIDLTNNRYGRLFVIKPIFEAGKHGQTKVKWLCKCDCGNEVIKTGKNLRQGITHSCGCLHKESLAKRNKDNASHRSGKTRLYGVWRGMKQRCLDSNRKEYPNYGGRGISICDEWLDSFESFQNWAYSSGYDEHAPYGKCTLDRIDVNGNYEPSNCRWVDAEVQASNRRKKAV